MDVCCSGASWLLGVGDGGSWVGVWRISVVI